VQGTGGAGSKPVTEYQTEYANKYMDEDSHHENYPFSSYFACLAVGDLHEYKHVLRCKTQGAVGSSFTGLERESSTISFVKQRWCSRRF